MRRGAFSGWLVALWAAGCAATSAPPTLAPPPVPPRAWGDPPVSEPATAPPLRARAPVDAPDCTLAWPRHDVGTVLVLSGEIMARPMDAVVGALCRCTRPGEEARIVSRIDFHDGVVVASAPDAPAIDGCLAQIPLSFEPYRIDGPATDCIDCGPRRFGVLPGSLPVDAPAAANHLRVVFPLQLDRSSEAIAP